ncbi:MAG TPA: DUF2059 domain-containing protein [Hyphomicrobiaceae bacterium]|nr:DUF2059 domain-containing protein [Hyphomicrobiaceae bacterium]
MKRTLALVCVLACGLCSVWFAAPLVAQQATPEPDDAHVVAARELVVAMDAKAQTLTSVAQLRQALIMRMQATEPKKVVGFTAYADKEMAAGSPRVTQFLADIENIAVQFYARNFTPEEMKAIAAFQHSPAGRKFNKLTPELGGLIASRMGQFQSDVIKAIEKGAAGEAEGK